MPETLSRSKRPLYATLGRLLGQPWSPNRHPRPRYRRRDASRDKV